MIKGTSLRAPIASQVLMFFQQLLNLLSHHNIIHKASIMPFHQHWMELIISRENLSKY